MTDEDKTMLNKTNRKCKYYHPNNKCGLKAWCMLNAKKCNVNADYCQLKLREYIACKEDLIILLRNKDERIRELEIKLKHKKGWNDDPCEICQYKQEFKHLQTKNGELKYKNSALENELNVIQHNCNRGGCKYFDNGEFKVFYICTVKQILDEIEEIVKKITPVAACNTYHYGQYALASQILDIINKAEEVNNDR